MSYRVEIQTSALRELKKLSRVLRARIEEKIDTLSEDPRPPGVVKLKGKIGLYRIRAGEYRIIYQIKDDVLQVLVVHVRHRREVYR